MSKVLVTGGTGFIGSHTVIELINQGDEVIIIDNLSNSDENSINRIEEITGVRPTFIFGDMCDFAALKQVFDSHRDIDSVIHFAAFKAVGESVQKPLHYYNNNLNSLINLLNCMNESTTKNLIFSSSCTVYGQPDVLPVTEETPLKVANSPYGNTKQISESIIRDFISSGANIKAVLLRYFNPVGAHISGKIGELPQGIPNNLMPYITQTALGLRDKLMVFGSDYNTPDGTAIRDYIHVSDLAIAHLNALTYIKNQADNFIDTFNIGTGEGYSVLQVIESINKILDKPLPYEITNRRAGDIEQIWANADKSREKLGWIPKYSLDDMTSTAYHWEKYLRGSH